MTFDAGKKQMSSMKFVQHERKLIANPILNTVSSWTFCEKNETINTTMITIFNPVCQSTQFPKGFWHEFLSWK
uniref:Uncharacterized protein n=1 Tax=Caenorhabditis tropicalis TaxID=1561998 RepID=A0A1I7V1R2_9PELO